MSRVYDTWWDPILAIPPRKTSAAYKRLRHIWLDQTRVRPKHGHEYFVHDYETHLTIALWENFAALPARFWLPLLVERAGLSLPDASISDVNWSYGWVSDGADGQIVDLVLNYRDRKGEGILVVEAKRPGNPLGGKDLDPQYYLGIPAFQSFDRRSMLYLVGSDQLSKARTAVHAAGHDTGFLTWPELGAVQIDTAVGTFPDEAVGSLIANAIYRQFGNYQQIPSAPPLGYLQEEPTRESLASIYKDSPQSTAERKAKLWRLGRGQFGAA